MNALKFIKLVGPQNAQHICDAAPYPHGSYFLGIQQYERLDYSHQYDDCVNIHRLELALQEMLTK